jgi:hypothetical protein
MTQTKIMSQTCLAEDELSEYTSILECASLSNILHRLLFDGKY